MKAPCTILLVEDNPADVVLAQRAFRESDLPVHMVVVRDGQEAVDYVLHQGRFGADPEWRRPDLILLDLNLPRLTGYQVLEQVRGCAPLRSVPVVVFTTSRREEDVRAVYAAGANTYIQKPQEFRRFVELLRLLGRYWLEAALLPGDSFSR